MLDDIIICGVVPMDLPALRAETRMSHRVRERKFLLDFIPQNSTGAELGVFTGLFSSLLAREPKIARVTFVDPWWTAHGDYYGDWGAYTDFGRLSTRTAHALATKRVVKSGLPGRSVEVAFSYDWLERQPDQSLDFVYIDSTHTYEGTRDELSLLNQKLKANGLIMGDDWRSDRNDRHHGVCLAVNEFIRSKGFEVVLAGMNSQWIIRRPLADNSRLPLIRKDMDYRKAERMPPGKSSMPGVLKFGPLI
jgi:hypothetical protein